MRIISFTKKWAKLSNPEFTTFRLPRKDSNKGRDWHLNETLQIYYHSRCKDREYLGNAVIINKQPRFISSIDDNEAVDDEFNNFSEMYEWLNKAHGGHINPYIIINKLTFKWVEK